MFKQYQETLIKYSQEYILNSYKPTNAREYEILGRAIQGCNQIVLLDDFSILNGYGYIHNRFTNADWRASELIDEAIKNFKLEG